MPSLQYDNFRGIKAVQNSYSYRSRRVFLHDKLIEHDGGTHRLLPITPEFAELLAMVPEADRKRRVFKLRAKDGNLTKPTRHAVGPKVAAVGKAAGVVTDQREKKGEIVKEFASAHDLRRAFGFRWSRRVMPTVLRELMRHESIETTMKFYVGVNAEATADELWAAVGTVSGTSGSEPRSEESSKSSNTL